MATKLWAIGLAFLCAILVSVANIFQKLGAERLPEIITNWPLFLGIVIYGLAFVTIITAFKYGEVTVLYPIVATSYIIVTFFALFIFQEPISMLKWTGVLIIFAGVTLVGMSRK